MKCKNKSIMLTGLVYDDSKRELKAKKIEAIITNDEQGKTLSLNDGKIMFSIPFEDLEKWLR